MVCNLPQAALSSANQACSVDESSVVARLLMEHLEVILQDKHFQYRIQLIVKQTGVFILSDANSQVVNFSM